MKTIYKEDGIYAHPVEVTHRDDGSMLVKAESELAPYAEKLTDRLVHWAETKPDQIFIAQRDDQDEWQKLTYSETLQQVRSIASYLAKQNLSAERPVLVLSGNSIEQLLVGLAAMYIGVPYTPTSPAYSLISKDYEKLKYIHGLLTPGLLFCDDINDYASAINALDITDCLVVSLKAAETDLKTDYDVVSYADVLSTPTTSEVEELNAKVNAETIAKILFTSGSTGMPKGVINTQRMICSNQQMLLSVFPFMEKEAPVLLDWLPWNHTFGGNHNVGIVIYNGGTLYLDNGKPVPKGIAETLKNLAEISPTIYFNVPKGYEILVHKLKDNPDIAKTFFRKLRVIYYAGAGMAQHVWDDLYALAEQYAGHRIPILTGLGSTETAPGALFSSVAESASGVVGTPAPGIELKLVPNLEKLELRIKGISITPGYWREDDKTKEAFDEEGYYCLGDALKFIDPQAPSRGFIFDGRVSEDFKLDTGTWVAVGNVRVAAIEHFAPLIQDIVITGRERGFVGGLVFPDVEHCRALIPDAGGLSVEEIINHENVRNAFAEKLQAHAAQATGSSNKICSLILQSEPAQLDASEITDKGSLNQNAVVARRQNQVLDIYSADPSDRVITIRK